jgi:hypothetical protein
MTKRESKRQREARVARETADYLEKSGFHNLAEALAFYAAAGDKGKAVDDSDDKPGPRKVN